MSDSTGRKIANTEALVSQIDPHRLLENLWQLVCVPSPTGREKDAALCFAKMLEAAGSTVEIDQTLPDSPNVIGRLKGNRKGPTLQLAGHIDHIDLPHPKPKREAQTISGRGAADMKNGLAGILEVIRILKNSGSNFPGEILVTVYGLHEAPEGDSSGLFNLLDKGIKGDAAVVFEGPDDAAVIMANGMSIWNLHLYLGEPACHELSVAADRPDLLRTASTVADVLKKKDAELRNDFNPFPLLAQESLFVAQLHYGDFYNRAPNTVFMQGTRRWHPDKSFKQVREDFDSLIKSVQIPQSVTIDQSWLFVGGSYEMPSAEKIVKSLIAAFQAVHHKPCPIKGHSSVTDACRLVCRGNVPAILCGFGTETGHSDYEFVELKRLQPCCAVALRTILNYLDSTNG